MCFGNVEKLYEIKFIPTEQKNIALLDNCCKINHKFLKNDLLSYSLNPRMLYVKNKLL